ncbi:hypothetical protein GALMADRAFT_205977 [Galerina marginata CBS 339.88]|uniref:DUF6533 domain-containing protein n=1 Tax=Galerina marginata (strain CBS 339.88) TaxID=685588 RepID=A0A067TM78_GALM3|nr:hypothetical protein GALMADRAFT_205977 [Galerina marginata CBS 339.88]
MVITLAQAPELAPISFDEETEFLSQLMTTRYVALCGLVIVLYDWIITLEEEVNGIWPAKWSATKAIFLLNRYITLASQLAMIVHFTGLSPAHSHITCAFYIVGYGVVVFFMLASVHVLVLLRAWAIWNRQPWITISLTAAYIIYAIICIALIVYSTATAADSFILNIHGTCISFTALSELDHYSDTGRQDLMENLSSLVLEYVSFGFTLASISRSYTGVAPGFRALQPLARRLYLSALVYISFSTVCHIFNMVMWGLFWKLPYNMLAVTYAHVFFESFARLLWLKGASIPASPAAS